MRLENNVALFTAPPIASMVRIFVKASVSSPPMSCCNDRCACIARIADEHRNHSEHPEEGKRVR